jgi:hypothetical protein
MNYVTLEVDFKDFENEKLELSDEKEHSLSLRQK